MNGHDFQYSHRMTYWHPMRESLRGDGMTLDTLPVSPQDLAMLSLLLGLNDGLDTVLIYDMVESPLPDSCLRSLVHSHQAFPTCELALWHTRFSVPAIVDLISLVRRVGFVLLWLHPLVPVPDDQLDDLIEAMDERMNLIHHFHQEVWEADDCELDSDREENNIIPEENQ